MSKNNQNEYMKRMRPQRQRFALRKLTVGVASVLLGVIFFIGGVQADADTPTNNGQAATPARSQLASDQQESATVTAQLINADGSMRSADGQQVMAHNDNVQVAVNYQNDRLPAGQPITISYSNPRQWTVVDWEGGVSKQLSNNLTATNNGNGTFTVKSNVDKNLDINFDLHFALQYAGDVGSNTSTSLVIATKRGTKPLILRRSSRLLSPMRTMLSPMKLPMVGQPRMFIK
ncbi:YSIRK-type signal peptide-containing protein [Limosilactobacillus panis]|uniref:YSIRK-type signal peptide-containing protein n=1 Tax=Limosilactobacillus panis TaxID=47493 RepID=UPI0021BBD370|nr:YSIRK-type signal peptide-containing protein [Limosilactobacillus panis]